MFNDDRRPGQRVSMPPWGVRLGPDEDRLEKKPGKAECELQRAVEHGKWEKLNTQSKLWLLQSFAIEHSDWSLFTPRCQMWVLCELGRLLSDQQAEQREEQAWAAGEDEEAEEVRRPSGTLTPIPYRMQLERKAAKKERSVLMSAISQTRLPRIVRADPPRARQLADICGSGLALQKVRAMLQAELEEQTERKQRLAKGETKTVSLPRVQSASSLTRAGPSPSDGRAGGKKKLQLQHSSSDAGLHKSRGKDGRGERAEKHTALKETKEEPKEDPPSPSRLEKRKTMGRLDSTMLPEELQATTFEGVAAAEEAAEEPQEEESADPEAPRTLLTHEEFTDPENRCKFRNVISIVPMKSQAWRKVVGEEQKQRRMKAGVMGTLDFLRDRLLCEFHLLPHARVRALIPPKATHVAKVTKGAEPFGAKAERLDVERVQMAENEEPRNTYDVVITGSYSVTCLAAALHSSLQAVKDWTVEIQWPLELAQTEISSLYPDYVFSEEQMLDILASVTESNKSYLAAWEAVSSAEPKDHDSLVEMESYRTYAGLLLQPHEGQKRQLREDRFVQGVGPRHQKLKEASNSDVLKDAANAHQKLKELLAPGSDWAKADLNDRRTIEPDDESRTFPAPESNGVDDIVPAASLYDPGVMPIEVALERARRLQFPCETAAPVEELTNLSRIDAIFSSLMYLTVAMERFIKRCDVVWCHNYFVSPPCTGQRYVSIGLRLRVEVPKEPEPVPDEKDKKKDKKKGEEEKKEDEGPPPPPPIRDHIVEVRLWHSTIYEVDKGPAQEIHAALVEKLLSFGVHPTHAEAVLDFFLEALDRTDGRKIHAPAVELVRAVDALRAVRREMAENDRPLAGQALAVFAAQAQEAGVPAAWIQAEVEKFELSEDAAEKAEEARRQAARKQDQKIKEDAQKKAEEA
eukprot:TRINITY_DN92374_c0_g1_i1.p1 TRINITY_DN92374_c0_g1~~TRINITY_DN92374_c0_g1_i1.p1  ORF type:complete len:917 (-),score=254.90 TRINITY_DN92374_c0_g1_i1:213-2963(-)